MCQLSPTEDGKNLHILTETDFVLYGMLFRPFLYFELYRRMKNTEKYFAHTYRGYSCETTGLCLFYSGHFGQDRALHVREIMPLFFRLLCLPPFMPNEKYWKICHTEVYLPWPALRRSKIVQVLLRVLCLPPLPLIRTVACFSPDHSDPLPPGTDTPMVLRTPINRRWSLGHPTLRQTKWAPAPWWVIIKPHGAGFIAGGTTSSLRKKIAD